MVCGDILDTDRWRRQREHIMKWKHLKMRMWKVVRQQVMQGRKIVMLHVTRQTAEKLGITSTFLRIRFYSHCLCGLEIEKGLMSYSTVYGVMEK